MDNPGHFLKGLTRCSVPEFVSPFGLMLSTECVRQTESDSEIVNDKSAIKISYAILITNCSCCLKK